MQFRTQARADWRVLTSAALVGSGVGLALGAAYMAGGMSRAADDHARASRLAEAASGRFSESILQREAAAMDPGVLRVARRHDPFTVAGAAERDRQNAILAARLERQVQRATAASTDASALMLRASLGGAYAPAAAPYRLAGALDSSRELECLTQAVYFEARGETPAGQAAVAQVVLNRVRHPAFPKTVCGVVYQGAARRTGCQFSFACDGSMRRGREAAAWNRARRVASRALSGAVVGNVGDATHFHTVQVAPNWGPSLMRVSQVGLHVFYRFGRGGRSAPRLEADAPELAPRPVFASLAPVPAPPVDPAPPADLRLTSAVATETSKVEIEPTAAALQPPPGDKAEAAKLTPASQARSGDKPPTPAVTAS